MNFLSSKLAKFIKIILKFDLNIVILMLCLIFDCVWLLI